MSFFFMMKISRVKMDHLGQAHKMQIESIVLLLKISNLTKWDFFKKNLFSIESWESYFKWKLLEYGKSIKNWLVAIEREPNRRWRQKSSERKFNWWKFNAPKMSPKWTYSIWCFVDSSSRFSIYFFSILPNIIVVFSCGTLKLKWYHNIATVDWSEKMEAMFKMPSSLC